MKVRLAILIVLTAGMLFPKTPLAETAANVDVQQLRYKFKYLQWRNDCHLSLPARR